MLPGRRWTPRRRTLWLRSRPLLNPAATRLRTSTQARTTGPSAAGHSIDLRPAQRLLQKALGSWMRSVPVMQPKPRLTRPASRSPGTNQRYRWLGRRGWSHQTAPSDVSRPTRGHPTTSSHPSQIQLGRASSVGPLRVRTLVERRSRMSRNPSSSPLTKAQHRSPHRSRASVFVRRPPYGLSRANRPRVTWLRPLERKGQSQDRSIQSRPVSLHRDLMTRATPHRRKSRTTRPSRRRSLISQPESQRALVDPGGCLRLMGQLRAQAAKSPAQSQGRPPWLAVP